MTRFKPFFPLNPPPLRPRARWSAGDWTVTILVTLFLCPLVVWFCLDIGSR